MAFGDVCFPGGKRTFGSAAAIR